MADHCPSVSEADSGDFARGGVSVVGGFVEDSVASGGEGGLAF